MQEPEIPDNEFQRLQALYTLGLLDTPAEERFDRITRLAKTLFDVPFALISLVDKERQWFKSKQGLDACETPRDVSFCGHAIHDTEIFYVPNALADERFADNPLVLDAPHIRLYAGAPLNTVQGYRVGTLCIIDSKPREFSPDQLSRLRDLADCVQSEFQQLTSQEAVQTIQDHEARLHAIFETVVDGIVTIDSGGVIQSVNPAALRIFGFCADEIIGNNVNMLMPQPYHKEHDDYLQRYLQGGKAKVIGVGREVEGRRKDGSIFPMELAVGEMNIQGQRMFTGMVRDITERKKVERIKSEFVSMVSHELRTPLTSIRGAIGLVLGNATGEIAEKTRYMLEMANRNIERLELLINDILDIEKIESDILSPDLKAVDLSQLTKMAIDCNEGYASSHDVSLHLVENQGGVFKVRGDENRLLQVFANLISNAVKYSRKQGRVEIGVSEVAGQIRTSVRDYGSGIADEFRPRMFQRFSQADSSDSRERGGTGLGLSISKAIIEQHGGSIDYHSKLGAGTKMYFDLPPWRE